MGADVHECGEPSSHHNQTAEATLARKSLRLLYVVNQVDTFLSHRLPWVLAAKETGFDVHVAMPLPSDRSRLDGLGITLHSVRFPRSVGQAQLEIGALAQLYRLYRRLRPDLVHHVTAKIVVYGGAMARLAGVPAVINNVTGLGHGFVAGGAKGRLYRSVLIPGLSFAFGHPRSVALFQNTDDRDHLLSLGVRVPKHVVIPGSGVDVEQFAVSPEPDGPITVMLASRLVGDKGVREFVAAARALRPKLPGVRFVLVGDIDPENPASIAERELRGWESEGLVEWWGRRNDMPTVLRQAHLFCLPSYREGLPRVVLEAAACGRPAIVSDVPGCRQAVAHGENGLLVAVRDSASLADAIARLAGNTDERRRMGERARERAQREFATTRIVPQILSVYRSLVGVRGDEIPARATR